jgi:serine/threonine-protein kinase
VAHAAPEEVALLRRIFQGNDSLYFAETPEQARVLAGRGNLAAMLVCGDEARAAGLVEWMGAHAEGAWLSDGAPAPRVLFSAPVSASRLLEFFNAGWIFRWIPQPFVPAVLQEAVESACADFSWRSEREHLEAALVSHRGAGQPDGAPASGGPSLMLGATRLLGSERAAVVSGPQTRTWSPSGGGARQVAPPLTAVTDDRYQDPRPLALGGMGAVLAYTDTRLGRRVALKTLQERYAGRPDLVAMLAREARVTGSLAHPNIIPVYDAGQTAQGLPFYVMKLVEAPTLHDLLRRRESLDEELSDLNRRRLLRVFVQVCQAVDFAHSRGVIHCDLKPANVLLGSFGQVLVVDWGLAYIAEEQTVYRGGTLGYLSPEQMGSGAAIDGRTDIYGLGSILYEVLSLRPPFDERAYRTPEGIRHPGVVPPWPRAAAPDELEEICLRAMAVRPEDRYATAGALGRAVESFLEGNKERERRRQRADELVRGGEEMAGNYFELVSSLAERALEVEALRSAVAPWERPERKAELWDAEDGLAVTDRLAVRTLQVSASMYERALDEVRDHPEARRGLVRLYTAELKRAERRRDERERGYFERMVAQYDDGGLARAATGSGWLTVECEGGPAEVEIAHFDEQERRLVTLGAKQLGTAPVREFPLGVGSYLATVSVPGQGTVRFPVVLRGGERLRLFVDARALAEGREGEVLVAGGPATLGGDEGGSDDHREVDVPTFFVQVLPVPFREYLTFLAEVMGKLPETARALMPCDRQGAPLWRWDGRGFVAAAIEQWGEEEEPLLDLPVCGIDVRSVGAYAQWKSRSTGLAYRLPTEDEWEKAGRGMDGRRYPWGNRFDAAFCGMRESAPGVPRPRRRGQFEDDVSPFGVRDLAGGIADWVTIPPRAIRKGVREIVSRGGAWCDWQRDCLLTAHRPYVVGQRSARVGFRLVRPGPRTVGYARFS